MSGQEVLAERRGAVAWITINRPEVLNARDWEMSRQIVERVSEANDDPSVRVIVFTGAGERSFCAGLDVKWARNQDSARLHRYREMNEEGRLALSTGPKPTIARLNGLAYGGGLALATSCDIVVAVDSATLSEGEIRVGRATGAPHTLFVGYRRALELSFGRVLTATEAEQWGLINRSVPSSQLDDAVDKYVQGFLELSPKALTLTKKMARFRLETLGATLLHNYGNDMLTGYEQSDDSREAAAAFLEKRTARFSNDEARR